jgi:carbohydrate-selective porin OprB
LAGRDAPEGTGPFGAAKIDGFRVADVPHLDFESVLETTYVYPINNHWQLQPDFQWVIHPGGSSQLQNAVVFGLRSIITF